MGVESSEIWVYTQDDKPRTGRQLQTDPQPGTINPLPCKRLIIRVSFNSNAITTNYLSILVDDVLVGGEIGRR
jgi:hypothetical protein